VFVFISINQPVIEQHQSDVIEKILRHCGIARHSKPSVLKQCPRPKLGTFYRPRDHEASPFFKIVRDRFDDSKHRMCEEHGEAARRAATWMVAVNSSEYIRKSIRNVTDTGGR